MIYITILLFTALVFKCWKRRRDSFKKKLDAHSMRALNFPLRTMPPKPMEETRGSYIPSPTMVLPPKPPCKLKEAAEDILGPFIT